jgi:ribosomal peptide maturation radical SAM protein 1
MAEVPLPDYNDYFAQLRRTSFGSALEREVEIPYESSRGCWWGQRSLCRFCGFPPHRLAFRPSDPDRVLAEVTELARRHRVLWVSMYDKIFDPRYLETLLPRLRDAGQHFSIFFATKSNLERDHVRLMRQAGVDTIQPGIESLSTPILRLMNKGATAFQNVRLLKWCAEYGIWVRWYFIYGFPGEPPEEYEKMAAAVASFGHLQAPYMCQLVAERFSPYHERPREFGLELIGPPSWYSMVFPAKPEILADLAFSSRYRYLDGSEPDTYVAPLRRAVEQWQQNLPAGLRSLRYRRGPGFLLVRDRRPGLEAADYEFNELEGAMYLACEDGATPEQVWRAVSSVRQRGLAVADVADYLRDLSEMRLVYKEGNRYLALALPHALPEFPFPEALQPIPV